jgi:hypothetical protein
MISFSGILYPLPYIYMFVAHFMSVFTDFQTYMLIQHSIETGTAETLIFLIHFQVSTNRGSGIHFHYTTSSSWLL